MHELVQNEKNKEKSSRARPPLQTRTGPNASSNKKFSLSIEEKQQKRVAARAATAMAQVLHRRREPRSLMMWGDRKKVRRNFYFVHLHYFLCIDIEETYLVVILLFLSTLLFFVVYLSILSIV